MHAYVYREGDAAHAALYLVSLPGDEPVDHLTGPSEAEVEELVRRWVDLRYPRTP